MRKSFQVHSQPFCLYLIRILLCAVKFTGCCPYTAWGDRWTRITGYQLWGF
uniref:Uncharacterized protein n=1 Tax=Arundo donax TaxID=35708 RepID=A0A0A8YBC1_ARUDO